MEQLETIILALLTVVSPLAISRAKNDSWSKTAKVAVPVIVSAALALLYLYATGSITQGMDVITTILMVYGGQQLAYTTIMRWWSTVLEQRGQPAGSSGEVPLAVVEVPRVYLEGWQDTPALTGSDWRAFAEALPASEHATALLSVADAMDRDQPAVDGPAHRA